MKYAGIGARTLPDSAQKLVTQIGKRLAEAGAELHTGAADGVDQWFSNAALAAGGKVVLHIPWSKHSLDYRQNIPDEKQGLVDVRVLQSKNSNRDAEALDSVKAHHPAYEVLSWGAVLLHARNYRILVPDKPVDFVVAYPSAHGGGTMQGVRIAKKLNIPCVRLDNVEPKEAMHRIEGLIQLNLFRE